MKIRTKIIIYFLSAFIIIVALVAGISGELNTRSVRGLYLQELQGVFEMRVDQVRRYIADQKQLIGVISQEDGFQQFLLTGGINKEYTKDSQERLDSYLKEDSIFNEMFLLNNLGKVVLSTDKTQVGKDKKEDPYFADGLKGPYIKDVYLSTTTHQISYALSAPIVDSVTGKVLGVVVARAKPDNLFSILTDRSGLGKTGESFLINKDLVFLTPSLFLGNDVILKQKIETENAKLCFNPTEIAEYKDALIGMHQNQPLAKQYIDYRGVNIYGTHSYIQETGWCLITKIDQSEVFAPILQQIISSVIINLAGGFIFIILGILIARMITKPLEILHHGTEIIEKGDLNYRVGTGSKDEIGQLSRSFDSMVEGVQASRAEVDIKVEEQTKEIVERSRDMEDQRKAILNILEDVEEEKNKVTIEKDRIDAILHSIGDGVFVVDSNLKIILINDVAMDLCGAKKLEDVVGKLYTDILKFVYENKKDKVNDLFVREAISTGQIKEMSNHTILIRPDNTSIPVADSAAPLKDKDGKVIGCVVVFRDVTKERRIDRMKTEFISLASHQLRTPLSAIKWFTELLQGTKMDTEQTEFSKNIGDSTERMIELVNSLLNVSRIESGRIIIDPKPTDLGSLVKEELGELQPKIDKKQQKVTLNIEKDLPEISIDPRLIREVYNNLLSNALKYTPDNGEISITISKKDKEIISQITDTGVGIPEKDKDRVFQKFYRGDNVVKIDPNGNGLGLYLAKSIIESSLGKIWFESTEGKGTTFWFSLPLSGTPAKSGEVGLDS